jgi:hypothetical protein
VSRSASFASHDGNEGVVAQIGRCSRYFLDSRPWLLQESWSGCHFHAICIMMLLFSRLICVMLEVVSICLMQIGTLYEVELIRGGRIIEQRAEGKFQRDLGFLLYFLRMFLYPLC